jgi:hypothetical protein
VGALDALPHLGPVTGPELRQSRREPVSAGGQDVHPHMVRERGHLLVEPVPPGDLERDQPHFPRAGGDRQRALDPAHLEHVDGGGAERDSPPDRDRVDETAVEIVGAVDLDRRKQPGHRAGGHDRRHQGPAAEPARARGLDAGRHALERQFQVREVAARQRVAQHAPQRLERVQVRARPDQPDRPAPQLLTERQPQLIALPQPDQPVRRARRVGRDQRAVDRADRGAHHQVGLDARLGKRPQHADLVRAEQPSAAEYERCRHTSSLTRPSEPARDAHSPRITRPREANCSNGR